MNWSSADSAGSLLESKAAVKLYCYRGPEATSSCATERLRTRQHEAATLRPESSVLLRPAVPAAYRAEHPAHLKTGAESVIQKPPKLPSDKDPAYTYGKPVAYR